MRSVVTPTRAQVRSVALPVEHGGWGFLLEPVVAGLIAAPSWAGVAVALAAFGVFLLHQPLKVATKDLRKGRRYARTGLALRVATIYAVVAGVAFLAALARAAGPFYIPLLAAVPLALVQLACEARNRGRDLLPEAAGALALGASAPAILLAGGLPTSSAGLLWLLLALRTVPALMYVRARLRGQREARNLHTPALLAHVAALAVALLLTVGGHVSAAALAASALMLVRAVHGLWLAGPQVRAKDVGIQEMLYGLAYAVLAAGALVAGPT